MSRTLRSWIIAIVIIIILLIPIYVDYYKNSRIGTIKSYNSYTELVNKNSFAVIYVGKDVDTKVDTLKNLKKEFNTSETSADFKTINVENISDADKESFKKENIDLTKTAWVFLNEKEVVYTSSEDLNEKQLETQINKYLNHIIPEDEISYKTVSTYDEYMKVIKSKNVIMTVFGRNSCYWCNKFKPIYNEVAKEQGADIYYIDSDSFNKDEYNKILNSGLNIPAKCTESKEKDLPLSSGFGTPLTIFTKKGKEVDCIGGYVNKASLESKLKTVGMIK